MKKIRFILFSFSALFALSSCLKEPQKMPVVDEKVQLKADTISIRQYLTKTNFLATKLGPTGIYYKIITPGEGTVQMTANSKVTVKYTGRILDGNVFDDSMTTAREFRLGDLIPGWQVGLPLIQKGGQIRLIIASGYAYGPYGSSGIIPPNANLDFNIQLIDIK